jgi:AcrR family transcriptional regulator
MIKQSQKLSRQGRAQAPRGDETRERIVVAAIGVFGTHGFAGASTRMLAQAADANIQAIQYYFGGKQGLYLAAADHIAERVGATLGPAAASVSAQLGGRQPTAQEARMLLAAILQRMAGLVLSEESGPWARFMLREQMEPTEAFERVYEGFMRPTVGMLRGLVGVLLDDDPASEHVGARTLATIGHVVFFRFARAAVMRQLDWTSVGARELDVINQLIAETVAGIAPANEGRGTP